MAEVIVVGGFGSGPEQMKSIAHRIGEHLGKTAFGINFRMATRNSERLADIVDGNTVVTHSGGAKAVVDSFEHYGAHPDRLVAVAPPVPEQIPKLLWRGALINLGVKQEILEQLEEKFTSTSELINHPLANFGRIPALGHFAAIAEITRMQQAGTDATVALMSQDTLFDMSTRPVELSIERAQRMGVNVVNIYGRHCRFSDDPVGVLEGIRRTIQAPRELLAAA